MISKNSNAPKETAPDLTKMTMPTAQAAQPSASQAAHAGPEPSYIYGYISLVDPISGQLHVTADHNYSPPAAQGQPHTTTVRFHSRNSAETRNVILGSGAVFFHAINLKALMYWIPLHQDASQTTDPLYKSQSNLPGIYYNPNSWYFETIEMDAWAIFSGGNSTLWIPLNQRKPETPFSDPELPNRTASELHA